MKKRIGAIIVTMVLIAGVVSCENVPEKPKKAEPVIVHTTTRCTTGTIKVYAEEGKVFDYSGEIDVENSGWNGKPIRIVVHVEGESEEISMEEGN
ncbi:hypothetical protein NE683_12255 [Bariatricus massiliensis]|uniref:Uncharacterized protein n=1 Tax=Bariatricus massiliensis TaxID=1745713 RepID=A0ABS8DH09_9FIRM|nr:hypothetical protein [Bariatricus massiliensis]MCB7306167.1 hypothetical protein [Bariatricus massiliensis]MCB7375245.1 hypothetical protein [Bariatricus massiliensis]MCB7387705.1 hypothetical protein [Bariatricus massiliensis]MCB7411866.1 hypothetical protein [Bariatricus massiliensis]MCQ5254003.1 hypothetical protein [Bariatricus massiliensis]